MCCPICHKISHKYRCNNCSIKFYYYYINNRIRIDSEFILNYNIAIFINHNTKDIEIYNSSDFNLELTISNISDINTLYDYIKNHFLL